MPFEAYREVEIKTIKESGKKYKENKEATGKRTKQNESSKRKKKRLAKKTSEDKIWGVFNEFIPCNVVKVSFIK